MKFHWLEIFVILALANVARADNFMSIMGGGGDPDGDTTIFDQSLKEIANSVKNTNWKYSVSFDGGHSVTQAIVDRSLPLASSATQFTPENFAANIQSYKTKILNGTIKSGDQIMIVMDTHGGSHDPTDLTSKSHSISTIGSPPTSLDSLKGSKVVSMDDLQPLIDLSESRGVKLAIVDLSCHSGNTLNLAAKNTCMISATGSQNYGISNGFSVELFKALKPGLSLEKAFLNARLHDPAAEYPMINTEAGNSVSRHLYAEISPYLLYNTHEEKSQALQEYILKQADPAVCESREGSFNDLKRKIEIIQSTAGADSERLVDLEKFLEVYKSSQDAILSEFRRIGGQFINKRENFSAIIHVPGHPDAKAGFTYTWAEILQSNPGETVNFFNAQLSFARTPLETAQSRVGLEVWQQLNTKKSQIIAQYPELLNYQSQLNNLLVVHNTSQAAAGQIAQYERTLYQQEYMNQVAAKPSATAESSSSSDACAKFKF